MSAAEVLVGCPLCGAQPAEACQASTTHLERSRALERLER